jgi:hypothetical protein
MPVSAHEDGRRSCVHDKSRFRQVTCNEVSANSEFPREERVCGWPAAKRGQPLVVYSPEPVFGDDP